MHRKSPKHWRASMGKVTRSPHQKCRTSRIPKVIRGEMKSGNKNCSPTWKRKHLARVGNPGTSMSRPSKGPWACSKYLPPRIVPHYAAREARNRSGIGSQSALKFTLGKGGDPAPKKRKRLRFLRRPRISGRKTLRAGDGPAAKSKSLLHHSPFARKRERFQAPRTKCTPCCRDSLHSGMRNGECSGRISEKISTR